MLRVAVLLVLVAGCRLRFDNVEGTAADDAAVDDVADVLSDAAGVYDDLVLAREPIGC